VAVANDVLHRVISARTHSPLFDVDDATRTRWAATLRTGFAPAPGETATQSFAGTPPITAGRTPTAGGEHLTPPTDTSPVPTMLPTPAVPMPAFAAPAAVAEEAAPLELPTQVMPVLVAPPGAAEVAPEAALPLPLVPSPPPPGSSAEWRPDPFSRFELRYWDGFGWTEHVHGQGGQTTDPPR
jgi:hypothetical protein